MDSSAPLSEHLGKSDHIQHETLGTTDPKLQENFISNVGLEAHTQSDLNNSDGHSSFSGRKHVLEDGAQDETHGDTALTSLTAHADVQSTEQDSMLSAVPDAKRHKPDEFSEAILHMNDIEQLQFLAQHLESVTDRVAEIANATEAPSDHTGESPTVPEQSSPEEVVTDFSFLDSNPSSDTDSHTLLRVQSLPLLDNLSKQILGLLGSGGYQSSLDIVTQPESDKGQAYQILMSLFEQTKRIYSEEAFILAETLHLNKSKEHRAIIQQTNLATFVSAVFGSSHVGFFHLNKYFLDTFVPYGTRLLKSQGALYLDLKTQAYISAMGQLEKPKEEILEDLFPSDLEQILLSRRPVAKAAKALAPSETDFVQRCNARREYLDHVDPSENLSEKYVWMSFLRDLSEYTSRNLQSILIARSQPKVPDHSGLENDTHKSPSSTTAPVSSKAVANGLDTANPSASRKNITNSGQLSSELRDSQDTAKAYEAARQQEKGESTVSTVSDQYTALGKWPAVSPAPQKSTPHFQRRPWTKEEEEALMRGLDAVKGPYWSQILEMYGAGGRISEVLKDRNQVQLKDKARNLKVFFLKSGYPMPSVLNTVTGGLKDRANSKKNLAKQQPRRLNGRQRSSHNSPRPEENILENTSYDPNLMEKEPTESSSNLLSEPADLPMDHNEPSTVSHENELVAQNLLNNDTNPGSDSNAIPHHDDVDPTLHGVGQYSSVKEEGNQDLANLLKSVGEFISNNTDPS